MKKTSKNVAPLLDRTRALRTELARKIAFFIGSRERLATDVPGLLLSRRTDLRSKSLFLKLGPLIPEQRRGQAVARGLILVED